MSHAASHDLGISYKCIMSNYEELYGISEELVGIIFTVLMMAPKG